RAGGGQDAAQVERTAVEADRAEAGPGALERLGDRAAAAGRSEGRRVRVQEGDRGRAGIRRRMAERGAGADPGGRDGRGQAVYPEGAGGESEPGADLVLQGADREGGRGLRRGAGVAAEDRVDVSAGPGGAEPDRADLVFEARIQAGARGARPGVPGGS